MADRAQIQGMAALHCRLAQMNGHVLDKAAMRFSAMADYVLHVLACGAGRVCNNLSPIIWEAVSTAIIGDPMHIPGQPFDRNAYRWMEPTHG